LAPDLELNQGKSITWREWEEACTVGLTPIILINSKTADLCRLIAKERSALQEDSPTASPPELDSSLEKKLSEKIEGYHLAPSIQRFVDVVCKGHTDNWMKLDWDGSAGQALEYIRFNLLIQAAASSRRRRVTVEFARTVGDTLADLKNLGQRVVVLTAAARRGETSQLDAAQGILQIAASMRTGLFRFEDRDRYSLVVHELRGVELHPIARAAHPSVPW